MATTYAAWPGITQASSLDLIADGVLLRHHGSRLEIVTAEGSEIVEETRNSTLALNEAFVTALTTGDWSGVRITYPDAVRTLAVVLAANRSNESGLPVRVAEMESA